MRHFPLFLDLHGRTVAVIGGGEVALRKVRALLEAGARVTVVASELHPALAAECTDVLSLENGSLTTGSVQYVQAQVSVDVQALMVASWFQEAWFIVAATDDTAVNAAVAAAGDRAHKFVNVVDDAAHCSAIVPAIIDRSPLLVAVSTGGTAPMLARRGASRCGVVARRRTRTLSPVLCALAISSHRHGAHAIAAACAV